VPAEVAAFIAGVGRVERDGAPHPLVLLDLPRIFDSDQIKRFRRRA
jgi:hypothetical protein